MRELTGAKDLAIRTLPCRVEKVEQPADDVAILYLKLPTGERLQFLAGQYIDILMKDGKRRSFSHGERAARRPVPAAARAQVARRRLLAATSSRR